VNKLKDLLTRKFGPLPAWAWGALIAGGVYFYRKYESGKTSTTTSTASTTATTPTNDTGVPFDSSPGSSTPGAINGGADPSGTGTSTGGGLASAV
jgi:hypothetical protein